jgi:6-bladed beta-propeller
MRRSLLLIALFTIVAVAVLVTMRPFSSTTQLATTEGSCRIVADKEVELSGDHVEAGLVRITPQHIYLAKRSEIVVFDREGRFLRILGRPGSGPGEFNRIQQIVPLPAGEIAAIESNPPRLSLISLDGDVPPARASLLPVSIHRHGGVRLPDSTFLLTGRMLGSERSGHPLVRVSSTGTPLGYFGENEVERDGPLRGQMMPRLVAHHPSHGIVTVKRYAYAVEIWDADGTLEDTYSREVDWLRWPPVVADGDPHRLGPPEDHFIGVHFDDAGYLWLVAQTTPEEWRDGLDGGRVADIEQWTDTQIEVVDLDARSIICSARFKPYVLGGFAGSGRIASYREDAAGEPVIAIWRLTLVPD